MGRRQNFVHKPKMWNSIHKRYNEEHSVQNSLLTIELSSLKTQRKSLFLKQLGARQKLKTALSTNQDLDEEFATTSSNDSRNILKIYASQVPVSNIPNSIEKKILSFISKKQFEQHTEYIKAFMEDLRKHYTLLMQEFSIQQLLRSDKLVCRKKKFYTKESEKCLAKSSMKFLSIRKQFEKRFILTQKPMCTTLEYIIQELPIFKCNFQLSITARAACPQGLLGRNAISFHMLFDSIRKDIVEYNNLLRWTWYPKLISLLKQQIGKKYASERLYNCLEGLIARQIIEIKQNALSDLRQMLRNARALPTLCFKMETFEDQIVLNPTLQALEKMYVLLACDIANLGVGMLTTLAIELQPNEFFYSQQKKYIQLQLNEIYIAELIADIKHVTNLTYKPVKDYLEDFKRRFISIYRNDEPTDVLCNFKSIFAKIEAYFRLKIMLQLEPKNVYFLSAIIQNGTVLQTLSEILETQRHQALKQLTTQHIILLQEICNDFEKLKSRALKIPTSTEELLALTAFINKMELKELFERVKYAQQIGNQLLDVSDLSETHLAHNIRTLNWLYEIEVVKQMGAIQLDNFSTVFRGHLKLVTDKLSNNILDLVARAQLLSNINESLTSREQRIFTQSIFRQLNELEDCVSWINKEEHLFGIAKSNFPALEEVKETLIKFIK